MINRDNYKDVQKFLGYKKEQKCSKKTVEVYDVWLRHALEWCGETPFPECDKKKDQLQDLHPKQWQTQWQVEVRQFRQ